MSQLATARDSNVFVNCPFDENYTQFLYVTLFTLWCCGKSPQLTLLDRDSTTPRLNRITKMIWSSKYGVHDLSRCKALEKDEFFRMNMPFELGLDIGAKCFSEKSDKNILIIVSDKYDYQKALSDLSGNDPICYYNDAKTLSKEIRDWLYESSNDKNEIPTAHEIWTSYEDYFGRLQNELGIIKFNVVKAREFLDKIPEYITRKT